MILVYAIVLLTSSLFFSSGFVKIAALPLSMENLWKPKGIPASLYSIAFCLAALCEVLLAALPYISDKLFKWVGVLIPLPVMIVFTLYASRAMAMKGDCGCGIVSEFLGKPKAIWTLLLRNFFMTGIVILASERLEAYRLRESALAAGFTVLLIFTLLGLARRSLHLAASSKANVSTADSL